MTSAVSPDPHEDAESGAVAHLRVADWEPDDDDEVVIIPALPASPPQFLPVPSAWWETPAVTSRPLSPIPDEARTARQFVRELLTRWGLGHLSDDAELIVAELVGNAVRHGLRNAPQIITSLRFGDLVRFGPEHVIDIDSASGTTQ